jgi:hypothetical protein
MLQSSLPSQRSSLFPDVFAPSYFSHSTSLSDSDLPPLKLLYYLRAHMSPKETEVQRRGKPGQISTLQPW